MAIPPPLDPDAAGGRVMLVMLCQWLDAMVFSAVRAYVTTADLGGPPDTRVPREHELHLDAWDEMIAMFLWPKGWR